MKTTAARFSWIALLACVATPVVFAAAARSDLVPTDKRRTAIATGQLLARPGELPAVAADLISPFSPPDFTQPDPETAPAKSSGSASSAAAAGGAAAGPRMSSARDILETMTPLIPAKGTIELRGEWLLTIEGGKSFKVGDILNVGLVGEGQPKFPLEITRITKTDFTLRYQGEVKTRAIVIKPSSTKSP
jgi:hypothetical protein